MSKKEKGNVKITQKVFTNEELISKKYERLENYLKKELHIREDDIENSVETVIQAANGYYEGEENIVWLQGSLYSNIITDGKSLVPTGMFIWPIPRLYRNNITFSCFRFITMVLKYFIIIFSIITSIQCIIWR